MEEEEDLFQYMGCCADFPFAELPTTGQPGAGEQASGTDVAAEQGQGQGPGQGPDPDPDDGDGDGDGDDADHDPEVDPSSTEGDDVEDAPDFLEPLDIHHLRRDKTWHTWEELCLDMDELSGQLKELREKQKFQDEAIPLLISGLALGPGTLWQEATSVVILAAQRLGRANRMIALEPRRLSWANIEDAFQPGNCITLPLL